MPKNSKPRKNYTAKGVNPPVTQGLIDEFAQDMHFALMSLACVAPSPEALRKLGKVLIVTSCACDLKNGEVSSEDKAALAIALVTLNNHIEHNGNKRLRGGDITLLRKGVLAAERLLSKFKYDEIARGYRGFVRLSEGK